VVLLSVFFCSLSSEILSYADEMCPGCTVRAKLVFPRITPNDLIDNVYLTLYRPYVIAVAHPVVLTELR